MSDLGPEWGDLPYDRLTISQIVHDYVVTRGDLSEQYARDQLTRVIERHIAHAVDEVSERVETVLDATEWDGWAGRRRLMERLRTALVDPNPRHLQFTDETGTWCLIECPRPDEECGALAVEQNA